MQTAPAPVTNPEQKAPLVNLFAYLRDLFHLAEPETHFDPGGNGRGHTWWPLAELQTWDQGLPTDQGQAPFFKLNLKDENKPCLTLRRCSLPTAPALPPALEDWVKWEEKEGLPSPTLLGVEQFEDDPARVEAFAAFAQQVDGQTVEAIGNLAIPPELDPWLHFAVDAEDRVKLHPSPALARDSSQYPELQAEWESFSAAHATYRRQRQAAEGINALYEALHQAHFERSDQPDLGVTLSFGLLSYGHATAPYQHFLFHLPLTFQLQQQQITLRYDPETPISAEQQFTELLSDWFPQDSDASLEARRAYILGEIDDFSGQSHEFNFAPNYLQFHYHAAARRILDALPRWEDQFLQEGQPRWDFDATMPADAPRFSFSPVLRLRQPRAEMPVSQDADRILRQIRQLAQDGQTERIPDFFRHLFSLKSTENNLRIAYRRKTVEPRSVTGHAERAVDLPPDESRFYFPLPYNQEQLSIAQRLEKQDAVTVKGPPGTGKSHSIANLIAHHAAQGQRILVVSKNPKALEVIRRKLPQPLRDLALLFREAAMPPQELKRSIEIVSEQLTRSGASAGLTELQQQLDDLHNQTEALRADLLERLILNQAIFELHDPQSGQTERHTLAQWARRWAELPPHTHWLAETATAAELSELLDLYHRWQQADHALAAQPWPSDADWVGVEELRERQQRLRRIEQTVDLSAYAMLPPSAFEEEFLAEWEALQPHLQVLQQSQPLWQHPQFHRELLQQVVLEYGERLNQLEAKAAQFLSFQFDLSPTGEADPDQMLTPLLDLMDKYDRDGTLSLLKRKLLPTAEKAFYQCRINGQPVSSYRDLRKVADYLQWLSSQKQLRITVDHYYQQLGQAPAGDTASHLEQARQRLAQLGRLEAALTAVQQFNGRLSARQLPILDWQGDWQAARRYLAGLQDAQRARDLQQELNQAARQVPAAGGVPLLGEIAEAIRAAEAEDYAALRQRYAALSAEARRVQALHHEAEAWAQRLPQTLARLRAGELAEGLSEADLQQDRFQLQLDALLSEQRAQLEGIAPRLAEWRSLRQEREGLVAELAAARAWQARREQVSDEVLSSLAAWRNDLINVGKGHGKNTARHQASARANLQKVQSAIPVWIMQQDVVSGFFDQPEPGQFDLLIIDEASQCDISALNLIFRAKKSVIVGDENQTAVSTNANLFPMERTNQILDRYLIHHPFKQQFNLNNRTASIYSLSGVIYPNIITLREHFRCRPEIIDFSNQLVYHQQIRPLRTAQASPWGTATEVHYIEDDPKNSQKPQLARQAVQLLLSLVEDYESGELETLPTVGLICLESSNEAHRELLMKEIGREPRLKAYREQLELTVGTAREFQGDERDLMVLTCTASHSRTAKGKLRPPRAVLGEEMMRIYNVAMSRARDKVVLLHSILPEAIPLMNEACHRRRLLEWMMEGEMRAQQPSRLRKVSSMPTWQEEVLTYLRSQNTGEWEVNRRVGTGVLPLACVASSQPMGLCFDGEAGQDEAALSEALQQQAALERLGWRIYRLQALQWHLDRPAAEAQLHKWLEG